VLPTRAAAHKAVRDDLRNATTFAAAALAALALAAISLSSASAQTLPATARAAGTEPVALAPVGDAAASPLAIAAARGDLNRVRELLDSGTKDVDASDQDGTPALHWVARLGDADLVTRLLAAGAKVDGADRHGVTPLQVAIGEGNADIVGLLLDAGADASRPDAAGEPPLLLAARVGEPKVARLLLAHGAAVDGREQSFGQTPLMVAVREGHSELARALLDAGADPNARTRAEPPPRFIPPSESPPGLSKGIGIVRAGWPEDRGKRFPAGGSKTPLLYAARAGDLASTKLLVEHGAQLELADGNGVTPLLEAILNGSAFRVKREGRTDHLPVANVLLDAGANVNAMDWYGETPLWAAVDLRNLELGPGDKKTGVRDDALALIGRLLDAGANPNARTKEFPHERRYITSVVGSVAWVDLTGQTPFLRAAAAGDLTTMRLLLAHGADPNIATAAGTTPLMAAAGVNWAVGETFDEGPEALLEAVKLTHELGNDVNAVNSMGIGAIHGAANRGANDVIKYLAANGAQLDMPDREGRTPLDWAAGVFLATHPPVRKPETIALLKRLKEQRAAEATAAR
jgi:ankyrin repeat protein